MRLYIYNFIKIYKEVKMSISKVNLDTKLSVLRYLLSKHEKFEDACSKVALSTAQAKQLLNIQ